MWGDVPDVRRSVPSAQLPRPPGPPGRYREGVVRELLIWVQDAGRWVLYPYYLVSILLPRLVTEVTPRAYAPTTDVTHEAQRGACTERPGQ